MVSSASYLSGAANLAYVAKEIAFKRGNGNWEGATHWIIVLTEIQSLEVDFNEALDDHVSELITSLNVILII